MAKEFDYEEDNNDIDDSGNADLLRQKFRILPIHRDFRRKRGAERGC